MSKEESKGIVPREETLGLDATVSQASGFQFDFQRLNKPKTESFGIPTGPQPGDPCPSCHDHAAKLDKKRICPACGWFPETHRDQRLRAEKNVRGE